MGWLARATLSLTLLAGTTAAASPRADELEHAVKAEFVERFTRFIDWPSPASMSTTTSFVICVIGDTPMEPYLLRLARERRIKDRAVELRHIKSGAEAGDCHVLFIAPSERPRLKQILAHTSGRPILTIGDSEGYAQQGVLVNFFINEEGNVRFEISSTQLRRSGLNISAQLLRLARLVEEPSP
jgi:hypothetical protein